MAPVRWVGMPSKKSSKRTRTTAMSTDAITSVLERVVPDDQLRITRSLDKPASTYTVTACTRRGSRIVEIALVGRHGAKFALLADSKWSIGTSRSGTWRERTVHAVEHFPAEKRGAVDVASDAPVDREDTRAVWETVGAPEQREVEPAKPETAWVPYIDEPIPLPPGHAIQLELVDGAATGRSRIIRPWGASEPLAGTDLARAVANAWEDCSRRKRDDAFVELTKLRDVLEQIRVSCVPHVRAGALVELRLALAEQALSHERVKAAASLDEACDRELAYRRALELGGHVLSGAIRTIGRTAIWGEPQGGLTGEAAKHEGVAWAAELRKYQDETLASSPLCNGHSPSRGSERK